MSPFRSVAETLLATHLQTMPFEDAIARTRSDLIGIASNSNDVEAAIDEIVSAKEASEKEAFKLSELSTSHRRDLTARTWYHPGMLGTDGVWSDLKSRMSEGTLSAAVGSIDRSSDDIMSCIAQPFVADDRRRGLVVGNVQSGKTANYSAVIAKAFDTKYKLVIILSGIHNNLRTQTQLRLERDFDVGSDPASWHLLTKPDADFGRDAEQNASSIVARSTRVLAVVKKNKTRLENLLAFLQALDPQTRANSPILIIDDESDQATPDSSPDSQNDPTTINRLMKEMWAEVENGTYVGYTATPFANVFMNPDDQPGVLEELYPSDFIHVMPTPEDYFGAERIFGLDPNGAAEPESDGPDVVRRIPMAELVDLVPRGNKQSATFVPEVTDSLSAAIKWFVVAAAVRRVRGQSGKHSTMLVHTTHFKAPHFTMRDQINAFLAPLRRDARDDRTDAFYEIFHSEIDRAAELYTGGGPAPTWPRVKDEIPNVLRNLRVAVDNSESEPDERLNYQDEEPQTVIVIGGGTLSRGLTLEGLFVSFFTRSSNTFDTLLQMGRWFGYRHGYEDLQRIWVSDGLENDYRFLSAVECDLRIDIERMRRAGQTPREIGVRVRQHPGRLQITSPNKLKHAETVHADFEGFTLQTYKFDVSESAIRNLTEARRFLDEIRQHRSTRPESSSAGSAVYSGVHIDPIRRFVDSFAMHEQFREIFRDTVRWSSEKLPGTPWNVVLASGSAGEEFAVGDVTVRTVNRAPVPDDSQANEGIVNIRALMSGQDSVRDLRLLGRPKPSGAEKTTRLPLSEQRDWRQSEYGGAGNGLLIVYPISRESVPAPVADGKSQTRIPMAEAIRRSAPELATADAGPIIGIAVVAPFDTKNEVKDKGTFTAVVPLFEDDDIDEHAAPDSEKDYTEDI